MRTIVILSALALSACASDQYVATTGSLEGMKSALWDCKMWEAHEYAREHQSVWLLVGGGVGGALGGALAGAASSDAKSANQLIEECMAAKGYTGTSN